MGLVDSQYHDYTKGNFALPLVCQNCGCLEEDKEQDCLPPDHQRNIVYLHTFVPSKLRKEALTTKGEFVYEGTLLQQHLQKEALAGKLSK